MTKIKVRLQEYRHFYIHNDLANAGFHFKERSAVLEASSFSRHHFNFGSFLRLPMYGRVIARKRPGHIHAASDAPDRRRAADARARKP